ncbi:MAG: hypothetical protein K1060chlam5_00391 [Candidatus Anoxychlamydiales bacterium]|nr:hypothetical protein [Candidatus Anoxychlamydiales bacterium]
MPQNHLNEDDALQYARAYLPSIIMKLDKSLDALRSAQQDFMKVAIDNAFAVATTILISGVADAGINLISYGGTTFNLSKMDKESQNISKELEQNKNAEKTLDSSSPTFTRDKIDLNYQKDELNTNRTKLMNNAQFNTAKWQYLAQGLGTPVKSMSEAAKTKAEATKQIVDQLNQLTDGAYHKINSETINKLISVDFLSGLIALSQVQMR